jgi:hypothetical protein
MGLRLTSPLLREFVAAAQDEDPVDGLTHGFYRYPARFSPRFVRAALRAFTGEGDVVLDPFMGGGTTLVESYALGRKALGADISPLATFLARAKTRVRHDADLRAFADWAQEIATETSLHEPVGRPLAWISGGYQRNLDSRKAWPVRKFLEIALSKLPMLHGTGQRELARCLLLKTGQWALDGRRDMPTADQIRRQLVQHATQIVDGCVQLRHAVEQHGSPRGCAPTCLLRSAIGLERCARIRSAPAPRLILTSPPYPGVHVLYHRWQVSGGKETPAPFWIANCMDGQGGAHYTMGGRHSGGVSRFFDQMTRCFRSLASLATEDTVMVQLVGFANPEEQLARYLSAIAQAGFREIDISEDSLAGDGRIRRSVPRRKWYAERQGATAASTEVVLLHRRTQAR